MKIAITGVGIVSALGVGMAANKERLLSGKSGVGVPRILPTCHREWPIGEVPFTCDELAALAGAESSTLSRNILLGLVALKEAVADAGIQSPVPLVSGTTVGGMDITERYYHRWRQGDNGQIALISQHEAGFTTAELARRCGLVDAGTPSTACSSALNAIICGAGMLQAGKARQVVAGGTEAMTLFHLNGFASLGILSQSLCRPFQPDRDGINLGEGAAYIVLEEEQSALKRKAAIYGYLAGYANTCDAYHATTSSPDGDGAYAAMSNAMKMADIQPASISYINAHGTATVNNDASEWNAIKRVFGEHMPEVESTKPLTGHTTSASGSIETVFSIIRMQSRRYSYVMNNAFGFGGNDSSLILSSHPADLPSVSYCNIKECEAVETAGDENYSAYIPMMQARRMTATMRRMVVAAYKAIEKSGVPHIDGIIVGTQWGGMVPTVNILEQMAEQGEQDISPTSFMNSTHNAAAGTIARMLQCKGYNMTFATTAGGMDAAVEAARMSIAAGMAKNMLVCGYDEVDEHWQSLLKMIGKDSKVITKARVICLD